MAWEEDLRPMSSHSTNRYFIPSWGIYMGGESKARNQRIQNMFRMIGYGENLGSGFPLILNAWNEKHWIKPELIEQPELMQVKLTLYFEKKTLLDPKDDPKNDPKDDPKDDPKSLTKRQIKIIKLIQNNNRLTRQEIASILGLSSSTIKREISSLKEMAILMREGGRASGYWIVKLT